MPFIPHTDQDIEQMLQVIGVDRIEDLFDEIPNELKCQSLQSLPEGQNEMRVLQSMAERAEQDRYRLGFLGAGAYAHHIPAAVWDLVSRGEFMTAYTPYQAEASQGTLQVIYEYQSMIAQLTGMEVSNASLYDGATALAEAILMAVRCLKGKRKRVWVPQGLHPHYLAVCRTLTQAQGIEIELLPFDAEMGRTSWDSTQVAEDLAAVVIAQPNFFGQIEDVDALTDWTHQQGALLIAAVNPISLGLLKPPGEWGQDPKVRGADICVGEGQPLGVPLASGGPYFGFMCAKKQWVRQLPGRIVGRTTDEAGKEGFTLTLQAREQHIRRSKATSNICTNQGLAVTAATIFMSLLGFSGIQRMAQQSHGNAQFLKRHIETIPGVKPVFSQGACFHELWLTLPVPADALVDHMAQQGILAGVATTDLYPDMGDTLLVCTTEIHQEDQLLEWVAAMQSAVQFLSEKKTSVAEELALV